MTPATRRLLMNSKPNASARAAGAFVAASSQYLSVTSSAALQGGGVDFWQFAMVRPASLPAGVMHIWCKANSGTNARELRTEYSSARFRVDASTDGINEVTANTTSPSPAVVGTWYGVLAYHDVANGLLGIGTNAGPVSTTALAGSLFTGSAAASVGCRNASGTPTEFWDGSIAGVVIGKAPPLGIATLASEIIAALYNGGKGRSPASLTAAERQRWGVTFGVDFAGLNAATCPDVIGGLTLTNTNGVTTAAGPGA